MKHNINLARVYDKVNPNDGVRILADRLWPRGVKKTDLIYDFWAKELTPSSSLRKSWHQKELTFKEFGRAYTDELSKLNEEFIPLLEVAKKGDITLLSSVKDLQNSHLPILKKFIEKKLYK